MAPTSDNIQVLPSMLSMSGDNTARLASTSTSATESTLILTKQPAGLKILFFTELWERYGFYTIQNLLVLYLSKVFLFSDDRAYSLFGAFGAMIYATPVIGGYLADRYIGFRHAVFLGGILFILGYAGLALLDHTRWFYASLALLICGNGFFKSTVSSLLGELYAVNDIRRDSGFTIFYMGINIGSFAAGIVAAIIAVSIGWQAAFGVAAVGMIVGMATFAWGQHLLENKGRAPQRTNPLFIYLGALASVAIICWLLQFPNVVRWGLLFFSIGTLIYILVQMVELDKLHYRKMVVLLILLVFSIIFWTLYYQVFLSITLFIERIVDRGTPMLGHLFAGGKIPTPMFQAIAPFIIIIGSPLLGMLWLALGKRKLNPSAPIKFGIGLLLMGIGFFILSTGIAVSPTLVPIYWVVIALTVQTLGELALSPIGLSMITSLSPPKMVGMMMGVWFMSLAAATAFAGRIAEITAVDPHITDPAQMAQSYGHAFLLFGFWGVVFAIVLISMSPWLNRFAKLAMK